MMMMMMIYGIKLYIDHYHAGDFYLLLIRHLDCWVWGGGRWVSSRDRSLEWAFRRSLCGWRHGGMICRLPLPRMADLAASAAAAAAASVLCLAVHSCKPNPCMYPCPEPWFPAYSCQLSFSLHRYTLYSGANVLTVKVI